MIKLKENPSPENEVDKCLHRVANVLLLNASFVNNLGLLNGKMGIAIFFFRYARYRRNKMFEDYAVELIDEIYEEVNKNTPIDLFNGLTGIGWGIRYLVSNGFIDADPDEVLGDLEKEIFGNSNDTAILIDNGLSLFDLIQYNIVRIKGKQKHEIKDKLSSILFYIETFTIEELNRLSINDIASTIYLLTQTTERNMNKPLLYNLLKIAELFLMQSNSHDPHASVLKSLFKNFKVLPALETIESAFESDDDIINYCTAHNCNKMLYRNIKFNDTLIEQSAKEILLNKEEYWNRKLDKLNSDSFGLEKGWAGLGWLLICDSVS